MDSRKKKTIEPYDIWEGNVKKVTNRIHSSAKRNRKTLLPHPGQSYNPHPDDHEKLLKKIASKEIEHQKKQASLRKAFDIKVDRKELLKDTEDELTAGIKHLIKNKTNPLNCSDDSDGSSTDDAYGEYNEKDFSAIVQDKKVKEKRKSRQQRLKQMKDKLQRKAAKLRKLKNIRMSKFDAIKKITRELDKKEKEEAAKGKRHHRKPKVEKLCTKFEPSDPIYCLSSELPSNLRGVSCPLKAVIREQLENFQSRLLVEPTNFQNKKRKFKKREFERKAAAEQEG